MKHIQKLRKLLLTLAILMLAVQASFAASVSYVDGSGESQTVEATELAASTTKWTDGSWYIVPEGGLTISGRIAVGGTVNLILRDGATLTASAGIKTTGATLNIYAQSEGTGVLTATGKTGGDHTGGGAGIGGDGLGYKKNGGEGGTVNIYGGTITATGGNGGKSGGGGAGIGGGGLGNLSSGGQGGTVNIYGGTVTATGGNGGTSGGGGAGIGGGGFGWRNEDTGYCAGGTVNIYGGTVIATGGNKHADGDSGDGVGIGAGGIGHHSGSTTDGTLTLGKGVKLYNGTDNTGTVLDDSDSESRSYSESRVKTMFAEYAADTAAANAVIAMINALPATDAITSANKDAIEAARAAYDALTDEQKAKISDTVKNKLEAAETAVVAAEQPVTVAAKADPFTTGTYYATFYDSTTSYVADCEVYYATANADGRLTLQKAEGNVIKAGEGVILKATSETVTLTPTTTESSYDSLLTGSDTETSVENALVLSLGKNGVWFYKYSGTLGANKAYLAQ